MLNVEALDADPTATEQIDFNRNLEKQSSNSFHY